MRDVTEQLMVTGDPLAMGMGSLDHFDLDYMLTLGHSFPHHDGGYLLQRRALYPTPGEWRFCGFARRENDLLLPDPPDIGFWFPFPDPRPLVNNDMNPHTISPDLWLLGDAPDIGFWFPFPEPGRSDAAWQYRACKVLGNGFISENFAEPVRVDFDAYATLLSPLPMWPVGIGAVALPAGKFRITWGYDPHGQGAWPADFQVFDVPNWSAPLVDSETGLDVVAFDVRRKQFSFTTEAYVGGSVHAFGVRARNSAGVAERNINATAVVTAKTAAPSSAKILQTQAAR